MQDALDYDCELIRASTVSPKTHDDDDKDDESLREKRSVKRIPTSVGGVVVWSQWLGGGSPPAWAQCGWFGSPTLLEKPIIQ